MLITLAYVLFILLLVGSIVIIVTLLLFIESALTKGNKQRAMKHTVALCERAYIRGETSCINPCPAWKESELLYMNQMWWTHPEAKLQQDQSRIYWKLDKL